MAFLLAIVAGLVFGGVDQYLGSGRLLVEFGVWPSTASQMSAPWLILPFVAGCTQVRPGRAMLLGLVVTLSALVGYFALTLSPLEGVPLSRFPSALQALLLNGGLGLHGGNVTWVVAGLVTGPLYGLLGQRWRVRRSWISAVLVTGALLLEPVARDAVGQLASPGMVWTVEVAVGVAAAVAFAIALTHRRPGKSEFPSAPAT